MRIFMVEPQHTSQSHSKSESFSIAMCTYNGEKHLREQLESLAGQELLPGELILCDDGSTDRTVSIAEAFAVDAPFPVRIVRNPENLGYSRNFAQAVELCAGELIALCDQDDVWYPQKLARLKDVFGLDQAVGGVFSNGFLIDQESKRLGTDDLWGSFRFTAADQKRFCCGGAVDVLMQRNVVTGMTFAFRRSWKECLGAMPGNWNHDAWMALILADRSRLVACPEHLVAYRLHGNQQIGVPITRRARFRHFLKHGVEGYRQFSLERNRKEYRQNADQFASLIASLEQEGGNRELLGKARGKASHAEQGFALLSIGRLRRWPKVLRNLENYRRYSPTGLRAALRDLLL